MSLFTRTSGTGRDLVLLHGWGLHSGVFDELAAALDGAWRVTCVDLPGHGRSRAGAPPADPGHWAREVAAVVPPGAWWLGWSLGGLVALQHALDTPAGPAGLILVAATPRFVADDGWPGMAPATLEGFAAGLGTDYLATLRRFLALQVQGCADRGALLRRLRERLLQCPPPEPATLTAGLAMLCATDLRPRLPRLAVPSLWIFGERDRVVPDTTGAAVAPLLPRAVIHHIRGAGHAPFLSHTAALQGLLEPWSHGS